jgi:predicted nicotinamide N-methyase
LPGAPPALRASLRERLLELSGREPLPELLDVTLEQVPLPGGPATVARPADWQVLREAEAEAGRDAPYWAILWPSGEALADEVARRPPAPGAAVLELGCGLALPSLAATRAGARALATDASPDAVAFAAHTLALDEQEGEVTAIDWREPRLLLERGPWDLVLAADVLYLQRNVATLQDLLPKLITPGTEAWIADPGRAGADELLAWAPARFEVSSRPSARHEAVTIHRLRAR